MTTAGLSPQVLSSLRMVDAKYPYAYGYLTAIVRGYLDGALTRERLETVLDALEQELRGDNR